MKRFLSIIISIAMLVCMLPMTGMATSPAEDDSEKLVFDMDLSTYATDGNITNSVSGNDSQITVSEDAPVAETVAGKSTPAINFTSADNKLTKTLTIADSAFINQDELTVEMWVKADNWNSSATASDRVFALQSDNTTYMDLYRYGAGSYHYEIDGDPAKQLRIECAANIKNRAADKWTHLVFTRKWTPNEETTDNELDGTWSGAYYIDGLLLASSTGTAVVDRADEKENTSFILGGCRNVGDFKGSIAEFKVYNSILSNYDIKDKYDASVNDYYTANEDKLVFDMNINGNTITNAAPSHAYTTITQGNLPSTNGILFNGTKYVSFASYEDSASSNRNRYIAVNSSDFVNQDAMTFETWIRPTTTNSWGALFNGIAMMYYYFSSNLTWSAPGDVKPDGGSAVWGPVFDSSKYYNEWVHLTATREWVPDGNYTSEGLPNGKWTANLYINGKLLATKTSTGKTTYGRAYETKDSKLTIGNFGTAQGFHGDISTFKVYNTVLTEQKVLSKYKASKDNYSAVGSDGLIFDMDLSAYDGTSETAITNTVANNDSDIAVNGTPAVNALENSQKYLTFGNDAAVTVFDDVLINRDAMTIETWLRGNNFTTTTGMGDAGQIFTAGSYGARLYELSGNTNLWWEPAGDLGSQLKRLEKNAVPYNEAWTHVVFTREYDTGAGTWTGVLYINGQKAGSKVFEQARSAVATLDNKLIIGNNSAFGNGFSGDIASFKVYNKAFSIDDVSDSYMNSRSIFYGDVPFATLSDFNVESTSVTATLDSTITARDAFVVMALYDSADANANMLKAVAGTTIDLTEVELQEGYVVKCFVWNNITDLKPLVGAAEAICQGL